MPQFPIVRNHAPWHKTLLIPLWILELVFMITVFGLAVAGLTRNGNYRNYLYGDAAEYAEGSRGSSTVLGVDTGLSVTAIILTFAEALRLANRNLSPALFLLSNIIKLLLFVALVSLDGDGISRGYNQHRVGGVAGIVMDIIAILTILLALFYASVVLIQTRRVKLSPSYGASIEDADKPNPTYSTNPVPMTDSVPNTVIEPDITYHNPPNSQYQTPQNGYDTYRQTTGIATPAPRYQSYYSTDAVHVVPTPPPRFHELEHFGNERTFHSGDVSAAPGHSSEGTNQSQGEGVRMWNNV